MKTTTTKWRLVLLALGYLASYGCSGLPTDAVPGVICNVATDSASLAHVAQDSTAALPTGCVSLKPRL